MLFRSTNDLIGKDVICVADGKGSRVDFSKERTKVELSVVENLISYVVMLSFDDCIRDGVGFEQVGGKAHNLIFLRKQGFPVPDGFVVPTSCFSQFLSDAMVDGGTLGEAIDRSLASLSLCDPNSELFLDRVRQTGHTIRSMIIDHESLASSLLSSSIESRIVSSADSSSRYAVRSSGVAEDLPEFSFAGQMETYLNIPPSRPSLLSAILKCWASLFSDRALTYRQTQLSSLGVEEEEEEGETDAPSPQFSFPLICVVVQRMVRDVAVSGVVFSADPISHSRVVSVVNAAFGLGEGIVSGLTSPDTFWVRKSDLEIIDRLIGEKAVKVVPVPFEEEEEEGEVETLTKVVPVDDVEEGVEALSLEEIRELVTMSTRIEEAYGGIPQDIEFSFEVEADDSQTKRLWCLQARPITNLEKIPSLPHYCFPQQQEEEEEEEGGKRVYLCFNYLQVISDPFRPLGFSIMKHCFTGLMEQLESLWPEGFNLQAAENRFLILNGRIYVDITEFFAADFAPSKVFGVIENGIDSIAGKALSILAQRGFFHHPDVPKMPPGLGKSMLWGALKVGAGPVLKTTLFSDLRTCAEFIEETLAESFSFGLEERVEDSERLPDESLGQHLIRVFRMPGRQLARAFPVVFPYLAGAMASLKTLERLCGPDAPIEDLSAGILLNSKRMELALQNLAVQARQSEGVVSLLRQVLEEIETSNARISLLELTERMRTGLGEDVEPIAAVFDQFREEWGHRGPSEIDASNPRFFEDVSYLVGYCLMNLEADFPDYSEEIRRGEEAVERIVNYDWEQMKWKASNVVSLGLGNFFRSKVIRRLCRSYRSVFRFREDPKHAMMSAYLASRTVILDLVEENFVSNGLLECKEDCYYLYDADLVYAADHLDELITEEQENPPGLLRRTVLDRKREYEKQKEMSGMPHVVTSDGEHVDIAVMKDLLKDLPPNFLPGAGVAPGFVEGPARIILDPSRQVISPGDVIVAKQIDPAFSALFGNAVGLVSEVGGLMTHGSIVAREMGIPAVVCVVGATEKIQEGQIVRVDGVAGTVELVQEEEEEEGGEEAVEEESN